MGNKRRRNKGQLAPPPKGEQVLKDRIAEEKMAEERKQQELFQQKKEEFLLGLMDSPTIIAFNGENGVSHFGFPHDQAFLLHALEYIYGLDGKNDVFQGILASVKDLNRQRMEEAERAAEEKEEAVVEDEDEEQESDDEEDEISSLKKRLAVLEGGLEGK